MYICGVAYSRYSPGHWSTMYRVHTSTSTMYYYARSSDDLWRDCLNIVTFYYYLLLFANSPKNQTPVYKLYAPVANARLVNHRIKKNRYHKNKREKENMFIQRMSVKLRKW